MVAGGTVRADLGGVDALDRHARTIEQAHLLALPRRHRRRFRHAIELEIAQLFPNHLTRADHDLARVRHHHRRWRWRGHPRTTALGDEHRARRHVARRAARPAAREDRGADIDRLDLARLLVVPPRDDIAAGLGKAGAVAIRERPPRAALT